MPELNPGQRRGRPAGSRNKAKIDWYQRREVIWAKMDSLLAAGEIPPAAGRLLQSQLDTCNAQIALDHDSEKSALRAKVKEQRDKLERRTA
jgi:hypothetical protein